MAEITRSYEFVIMAAGSTSTADLTFTDPDFAAVPEYAGWDVDPLAATAESVPFDVQILDTSEQVTGALSDANGRADLLGRYWRLRVNEDGGGLTTVATGRIVGITLGDDLTSYTFKCGDELYLMRNYNIFETIATPTTQIWPPGLRSQWKSTRSGFSVAPEAELEVVSTDSSRSDSDDAVHLIANIGPRYDITPQIVEWLENDIDPNAAPGPDGTSAPGIFNTLRFRSDSTDYEVISFNVNADSPDILGPLDDGEGNVRILDLWVAWADGTQPTQGDIIEGVLYAPNHEPSEAVPYHVGGEDGVDPFSHLKDHLDDAGIQYDSNALGTWDASTNPYGLIDNPLVGLAHIRITRPWNLWEFAVAMMRTVMVAPFPSATGAFAPRSITLPRGITVGSLAEITASDMSAHPTWFHTGNEIKTVYQEIADFYRPLSSMEEDSDWSADRVTVRTRRLPPVDHDRVSDLGRHVYEVRSLFLKSQRASVYATELFNRYGDGPIRGVVGGLSSTDSIAPGDFIRITLASYPDIATQTRGGTRLVQVLAIQKGPGGARIEYIDAGSDDNALSTPAVAIVTNSSRPKHDVDITISSLPAAADGYQLQIRRGLSGRWDTVQQGTANETVTIRNLPSGTAIYARVSAYATGRTRSAWSSTANVTTTALTAPSGVSATANGRSISWSWTNGETDYIVMPTLDGSNIVAWPGLPSASTYWVRNNLDASTLYTVGVRHLDPYGGASAIATDTATTGSANTLSAPGGMFNRIPDGDTSDEVYDGLAKAVFVGLELGIVRTEPRARIEVQVDTSSAFSSDPKTYLLQDTDVARIPTPNDDTTRYARARYRLPGHTASAWTDTISMKPSPLPRNTAATLADKLLKTVTIPAYAFLPDDGDGYTLLQGRLHPTTAGASAGNIQARAAVVLPPGAIITTFRSFGVRVTSSDTCAAQLINVTYDNSPIGVTTTSLALTGHSADANNWTEEEVTGIDHTVQAGEFYGVIWGLLALSTNTDAQAAYVEIDYISPNRATEI